MKKFNFVVKEMVAKDVTIEAESYEEAEEIILAQVEGGQHTAENQEWGAMYGETLNEDNDEIHNWNS